MKPTENIEKFVRRRKPHVKTGRPMDKRVLDDSFAAMDETLRANKPSPRRIIFRSRAARLAVAAAAVIGVAIGLFMANQGSREQRPQMVGAVKSPAEMLTVMSLNIAYRRGGIEAVDEQSNKAFQMLGSKPAKASIQELLSELNGV